MKIADRDVRVWAFPLDVSPDLRAHLASLLASDERARADRFMFEHGRRRFTVARGWLRTLLGRCLGVDPASLRFDYSPTDKPSVAPVPGSTHLHFSLAHSDELAVAAVTRLAPVGVDVELIRPLENIEKLVARFFSPHESGAFLTLSPDRRLDAFFNLWTRREALLKATGEGLPGIDHPIDVTGWHLEDFSPRAGFVGAVAIERADARVLECEWVDQPAALLL